MAVALHPQLAESTLSHLVAVDISPAKGPIGNDFIAYIKAMKEIEASNLSEKKQVDDILKQTEPVGVNVSPVETRD